MATVPSPVAILAQRKLLDSEAQEYDALGFGPFGSYGKSRIRVDSEALAHEISQFVKILADDEKSVRVISDEEGHSVYAPQAVFNKAREAFLGFERS